MLFLSIGFFILMVVETRRLCVLGVPLSVDIIIAAQPTPLCIDNQQDHNYIVNIIMGFSLYVCGFGTNLNFFHRLHLTSILYYVRSHFFLFLGGVGFCCWLLNIFINIYMLLLQIMARTQSGYCQEIRNDNGSNVYRTHPNFLHCLVLYLPPQDTTG